MTSTIKLTINSPGTGVELWNRDTDECIYYSCTGMETVLISMIVGEVCEDVDLSPGTMSETVLEYSSDGTLNIKAYYDDGENIIYSNIIPFSDPSLTYVCVDDVDLVSLSSVPDIVFHNMDNYDFFGGYANATFTLYNLEELFDLPELPSMTVDVIDGKAEITSLPTTAYPSAVYTIHAEYSGTGTLPSATGEGVLTLHSPTPEGGGARGLINSQTRTPRTVGGVC